MQLINYYIADNIMTLAHLILAHSDPQHVARLSRKLLYHSDEVFIHVDRKTDITPFQEALRGVNVTFIQGRIKVYWAGYSVVEATVQAFKEILATGRNFDYINLISGQDYPIKSSKLLHEYLNAHNGTIFMNFESIENVWTEALPRLTQYHLVNYRIPIGKYRLEQIINKISPARKLPENYIAVGRSQWFTAPLACIEYIVSHLEENAWISRFFKFCWAPDEIVFQTMLYNSRFRGQMVNNNLRYIDWSNGGASPSLLTIEDADAILRSDRMFARKFSTSSNEIIDYLDRLTT
jgi:hypothetical protein